MSRRPIIEPPIYLAGAPPRQVAETAAEMCKACGPAVAETAKKSSGLIGAAVLGAVAAYFVPKILDPALSAWRSRHQADDVEFEVEDRDD